MKTWKLAIAAAMTVAGAQGAFAQGVSPNNYISLSAGPSKFSVDCTGTSACDDSSTAAKLLYGYKFSPNFALEGSVGTVGKTTATVPNGSTNLTGSIKGQYVGIGLAGLLPFGANKEWTGIARIGGNYMKTKIDVTSGKLAASDSDSKTQLYGGLGLNYAFTPAFELGVAWDTTRIEYSGSKSTVNSYNVVGTFKF